MVRGLQQTFLAVRLLNKSMGETAKTAKTTAAALKSQNSMQKQRAANVARYNRQRLLAMGKRFGYAQPQQKLAGRLKQGQIGVTQVGKVPAGKIGFPSPGKLVKNNSRGRPQYLPGQGQKRGGFVSFATKVSTRANIPKPPPSPPSPPPPPTPPKPTRTPIGSKVSLAQMSISQKQAASAKAGKALTAPPMAISYKMSKGIQKSFKGMWKTTKKMGKSFGMFAQFAAIGVILELLSALNPFIEIMGAITDIFTLFGTVLGTGFTPIITELYAIMLPFISTVLLPMAKWIGEVLQNAAALGILKVIILTVTIFLVAMGIAIMASLVPAIIGFMVPLIPLILIIMAVIGVILLIVWAFKNAEYIMAFFAYAISSTFASMFNGIITSANSILGTAYKTFEIKAKPTVPAAAAVQAAPAVPSLPTVPSVPAFANGGIVTGPTFGLIGEAGPEVIFPLDKLGDFMSGTNEDSIYEQRRTNDLLERQLMQQNTRGTFY